MALNPQILVKLKQSSRLYRSRGFVRPSRISGRHFLASLGTFEAATIFLNYDSVLTPLCPRLYLHLNLQGLIDNKPQFEREMPASRRVR